jgi:hypothetical protein
MLLFSNEIKPKFIAYEFNNKEQFLRLVVVAYNELLVALDVPEYLPANHVCLTETIKGILPVHGLISFVLYGGILVLADNAATEQLTMRS